MTSFSSIQDNIHYCFHDSTLLQEALLAAGAAKSRDDIEGPQKGNKRLALVGDAALRLAVLDEWFQDDASTAEGEQRVKDVGTNIQLEKVAWKWNFKDNVVKNPCQQGEVPRELLASTVEAIIGAVWIDSKRNLRDVQQVLSALYS